MKSFILQVGNELMIRYETQSNNKFTSLRRSFNSLAILLNRPWQVEIIVFLVYIRYVYKKDGTVYSP
jgi:hypothetical protein